MASRRIAKAWVELDSSVDDVTKNEPKDVGLLVLLHFVDFLEMIVLELDVSINHLSISI